jgi:hypothetical protein
MAIHDVKRSAVNEDLFIFFSYCIYNVTHNKLDCGIIIFKVCSNHQQFIPIFMYTHSPALHLYNRQARIILVFITQHIITDTSRQKEENYSKMAHSTKYIFVL